MTHRELAFYLNLHGPDRRSIMQTLAETGIRLIGLDGCGWDPDTDQERFEQFQNECDEFGLTVCSMHAVPPLLANAREDIPEDLIQAQMLQLRRFSVLGGRTAVYHACAMRDVPMDDIDEAIDEAGWDPFVERFARSVDLVAAQAEKYGITIAIENIWHSERTKSFDGFRDIFAATKAANVGFLLDSGHTNLAGLSVADEIRAAGPLLRDTHFHDNAGPGRDGTLFDQHIPVGLGTIDWQAACRALNEMKFPGPVVFEGVLGPGDSVESGRFGGALSHKELIDICIANWRASEALALQ